jgi:hypothetical protein
MDNALLDKFCFLRNVFTDGSKLSWNHSVNTSFVTQPQLWFLNALGFAALPVTRISSLWVPLAFEQGMNVIRSLDILHLAAPGSVNKRFCGQEPFHLCNAPALAQDLALQFFLEIFSQKDQQLRRHKIFSLLLWLENGFQIAF